MTESIMGTHLDFVQKLKDRGEIVLQPKVEKPMDHIDGYIKTQIPHKDAGRIFKDKYGTFGLFGDMGCLHVTGIKWEDLGLCDSRCWYEWMDTESYEEDKINKYSNLAVQNALNIRACDLWSEDSINDAFIEEENIDWVKVRKERRIKLVAVKQDEIESYILIDKLPDVSIVSTCDMPENWMVGGVQYDFNRNAFLFIILSPEFESIPDGHQFEVMLADQYVVKVIRERKTNEINCCAECKFIGKEAYHGSHIWCEHPKANGVNLPNKDLVIHPDCPIRTFTIVRHVVGEYDRNLREYLRGGD